MRFTASKFGVRLALLAGCGVGLRLVYVLAVTRSLYGLSDWRFYHEVANGIANGNGFSSPFVALVGSPTALHPPGFPFALAVFSALGADSVLAQRTVGAIVFGSTTIAFMGLLGRRVGGECVGLTTALIMALWPLAIVVDGALMSEALYGPLVAAILLCAYRLLDTADWRCAATLGVVIGCAALTRMEALAFVAMLGWPVAYKAGGRRLRNALVVAAACVVLIVPWTVRNAIQFGTFTPIASSSVIAGANCHETYYGSDVGGWSFACTPAKPGMNEAEQGEQWRRDGILYALNNIKRLPTVVAIRELRAWNLWPETFTHPAEGRYRSVNDLGIYMYLALLPLAAIGVAVMVRRRQTLWVLLAPPLVVVLVVAVSWGLPRLRYPADLSIAVLAAVALVAAAAQPSQRGRQTLRDEPLRKECQNFLSGG